MIDIYGNCFLPLQHLIKIDGLIDPQILLLTFHLNSQQDNVVVVEVIPMRAVAIQHCDLELVAELGQPDVFVFGLVQVFLLDVDVQP